MIAAAFILGVIVGAILIGFMVGRQKAADESPCDPGCPDCHGSGIRDSGCVGSWGDAIYVPCDCRPRSRGEL